MASGLSFSLPTFKDIKLLFAKADHQHEHCKTMQSPNMQILLFKPVYNIFSMFPLSFRLTHWIKTPKKPFNSQNCQVHCRDLRDYLDYLHMLAGLQQWHEWNMNNVSLPASHWWIVSREKILCLVGKAIITEMLRADHWQFAWFPTGIPALMNKLGPSCEKLFLLGFIWKLVKGNCFTPIWRKCWYIAAASNNASIRHI